MNRTHDISRSFDLGRAVAVARTQFVDRYSMIAMPLLVLGISFVINLAVWAFLPVHERVTGGLFSIYCYLFVAAILAVARGFGFNLGMGASRRAFSIGTGLTAVLLSLLLGTLMAVLNAVEQATGGWWMHGRFFVITGLTDGGWVGRWLILTMPFLVTFLLGAATASIYVRWNSRGMFAAGIIATLAGSALVLLTTWRHAWPAVGAWAGDLTPFSSAGWLLLICAALAAAGYAILRRASA